MITMIVTKIARLIITIIIIIKNIKFTKVIGYHKPQFGLYEDNVRVMLTNGLNYWRVTRCFLFFLNKMHSFLNFSPLLINL